ncbi:MAG: putative 4-hydroxybenzoate polyprenyltransferase [Chitinophagales bacterium]|nr:putative 4-hydroxybenzoate polyprenyltransferase [Chitinophagales bacterium]
MKKFLSLVKFSHTIFALPFAIIGFFLAVKVHEYSFSWQKFLLVLGCMVTARNAAMGFNRYIDRAIDAKNPRTVIRELPAGVISERQALLFVIANAVVFILFTFFINRICFYLSPIALLVILGYSYTKRFTALCHLILGVGLALAPIGAYLAVSGKFQLLPILFSCIVFTWVSGFDIIYALQDKNFDQTNNLHSIPSYFGEKKALLISTILHIISASITIYIGFYGGFGIYYFLGAAIFCVLLVYQHTLVKPNDLSKVNLAFFTTNGIASVIFAALFLIDVFTHG